MSDVVLPVFVGDAEKRFKKTQKASTQGWISAIFENVESRNIFMFLCLNLSFAFVELVWGIWTNSLGLITDSFHMFFDCTALVAGLVASVLARRPANERFSYGYGRAEVLGGFVNGLFLVFVALFVITEAVERFMEPPEVHTHNLIEVSVLGLLVNLVGIFAFSHAHTHGGEACTHSHGSTNSSKGNNNNHHGHSHGSGGSCSHDQHSGHSSHGNHGHSHGNHGHSNHGVAPTMVTVDTGAGSHNNGGRHGHAHDTGGGGGDAGHHGGDCSHHGHSHDASHHSHSHGHSHSHHPLEAPGATQQSLYSHGHSAPPPPPKLAPRMTEKDIKGEKRSMILDGVLLHVMADTLGSVSVIISAFLIHAYGWMIADPICSLFTAFLILLSVYPLLVNSSTVLMQRTPEKLLPFLLGCYQSITALNGVVSYREPHFWALTGSKWYGSIVLVVRRGVDVEEIRRLTANMFAEVGVNNMIIQIESF